MVYDLTAKVYDLAAIHIAIGLSTTRRTSASLVYDLTAIDNRRTR
jgi:hypothetical protein